MAALFLMLIGAANIDAQKFYVTLGGGYAFSAPGNVIGVNYISSVNNNLAINRENVYGTFGKGFNTNVVFGYMIEDYIGIEAGFSYLNVEGFETKFDDPRYSGLFYYTEHNANMSRVFAAIKITGGQRIKPYAKCGFVYGVGTEVKIDAITQPFIGYSTYLGGSSPGWFGALGVEYKLKGSLWVFLEGNVLYQVYSPGKLKLYGLTNTNTYELVDEWSSLNSNQLLRTTFPFSSIGINAGVKFLLGGKKNNAPATPEAK